MPLTARASRPDDWLPVETLNRASRRAMPKLWHWEDHLSDQLFVVVEHGGVVVGALFAWPDDSPVAWVRVASLLDRVDADAWLDLSLPPVLTLLRQRGTRRLAWLDYWGWAGPHLAPRGFSPMTDVETMAKTDRHLLPAGRIEPIPRPAEEQDIPGILAVDAAAFTPHWRYGSATVERRLHASAVFIVAEQDGVIVGYAEGDIRASAAHLNRVAVHPRHQMCGIGERLARSMLRRFWLGGAEQVTLNTQSHNWQAQKLYRGLGFVSTGERATAWEMLL